MVKPGPKPKYNEPMVRTTVRLPESLKEKLSKKATEEEVSINDYLIQLVEAAVNEPTKNT